MRRRDFPVIMSGPTSAAASVVPVPELPLVASATLLLNLQADALELSDNDPVSLWADASGNGYDFTQTGDARPVFNHVSGVPCIQFAAGGGHYLSGQNWAALDNLSSFTIFAVYAVTSAATAGPSIINKTDQESGTGWSVDAGYFFYITNTWDNETEVDAGAASVPPFSSDRRVVTNELISMSNLHLYLNGVDVSNDGSFGLPVSNFSNSASVRVGVADLYGNYVSHDLSAIMFYAPAPNASDRAAIEAWLAAKYGVTLP